MGAPSPRRCLVATTKIANSLVNKMLVDSGSAVNILYWDAYQKIGLTHANLSSTTSPLYGFIGDHVILKGTIKCKLAVTLVEQPRVPTIMTEFLTVNCPLAFNGVLGRPPLKAMKIVTSIHYQTMKFPIAAGTSQVRGRQWDFRECDNK